MSHERGAVERSSPRQFKSTDSRTLAGWSLASNLPSLRGYRSAIYAATMAAGVNCYIRYFARVRHRDDDRLFGIKSADRMSHTYIIGKTGTGKTTLLETLLAGDMADGQGCALLDPHGDLAKRIVGGVTPALRRRMVVVDPAASNSRVSFNPLARPLPALRPLVAAGLLDVFKMMWSDAWGSRMEHVLRNALLALLDQPKATLPDILSLISDNTSRATMMRTQKAHIPGINGDHGRKNAARVRAIPQPSSI